jgi:uncharacterized membrane protein YccC
MQTRFSSFQEALIGTAVGFFLSLLVQQYVINPVWGFKATFADNLGIVAIFTVLSVVRSYVLRRIFNWKASRCRK